MWLKKIFKREEKTDPNAANQAPVALEQDEQGPQSKIYTVPEKQIDLRYAQLKITKTKSLNLPLNQIHILQSAFFHEKECLQAKVKFSQQWNKVELVLTDKQLIMIPDLFRASVNSISNYNILHVPYGMILKVQLIENKKQLPKISFTLKDSRGFFIQTVMADKSIEIEKLVREFGFPNGINKFYAFKYGKVNKKINGWNIYNFQREMKRIRVAQFIQSKEKPNNTSDRDVYQIIDNSSFGFSSTYPQKMIIPAGITEKEYIKASKFRTKERLPILIYFMQYQKDSYVSLFRCSQTKGGLMTNRCAQDQKLIQMISKATQKISKKKINSKGRLNCKIYDARGYYAALGNKIAGKGFENQEFYNCQIEFLNIPNIHAVRDSYNKIKSYNYLKEQFLTVLGQSGWIDYLYLILAGAKSMVKSMLSGQNVVVHCSDGWDRTTQLTALTQIIMDPYYRTIQGFIVLFQKDWRGTGHKFRERSGQYNPKQYHVQQISPIFIQYLDCIVQMITQFPLSFEFNIKLLNFLAKAYQSNSYGTFLTNNLKQADEFEIETKTISVWSDMLEERQIFTNYLYRQDGPKILEISAQSIDFTIWKQHFLQQKTVKCREYQSFYQHFKINMELKQQLSKLEQKIKQLSQKELNAVQTIQIS